MARNYRKDLRVPAHSSPNTWLLTLSGILLARGYQRCVFGGRGPYIEFTHEQLVHDKLYVPDDKQWKIGNPNVDYEELRTRDGVKVYFQRRTVSYADYLPGWYYVSPFKLMTEDGVRLLEELKKSPGKNQHGLPGLGG
jgi:hypothetical protein